MGASTEPGVTTDGRSLLLDLQNNQKLFKRESGEWLKLQRRIDQIIAQNYLEYHNGKKGVSHV
jgi:hypothetical protein